MAGAGVAGLMTTVFPETSAGASFQAGMAIGKIPRRDETDHAERFPPGVKQVARQIVRNGLSAQRVAQATVKAEDVHRALHFAQALGERFAFFTCQQIRKLGLAQFENLRGLAQDASTRHGRHGAPGGERPGSGLNRSAGFGLTAGRILRNGFAGVRWIQRAEGPT